MITLARMVAVILLVTLAACAGKTPETRYYQLADQAKATVRPRPGSTEPVLVLETLATDTAYDDERIVYRTTPYRLDYYQYHRWSAAPGVMIGDYLEKALERSGRFRAVVRDLSDQAAVVLTGRILAIEEVDVSRTRWLGRLAVELTLADARTGDVLWTEQFEETEPLPTQTPEGLAVGLSRAMTRIAARATPVIAGFAQRQAALHAQQPAMARGNK
jgi:ABC-type uncharacterized transport system auxiliary subunit